MDFNLDQATTQFVQAARARTFWAPVNPLFQSLFAHVQDRAHAQVDVAKFGCPDADEERRAEGFLKVLKRTEGGVISQAPFRDWNGQPSADLAEKYLEQEYHRVAFTKAGEHFLAVRCNNVIHWVVDEPNFFAPRDLAEAPSTSNQ